MAQGGTTGWNAGADADREVVRLGLPVEGPCAALARTAAVAMGLQAGFGRSVLGRLALAVDEALVLLLPVTDDGIDLRIALRHRGLSLTIGARAPRSPLDPAAAARFETVAGDLVNSAALDLATAVVQLEVERATPGAATTRQPDRRVTRPQGDPTAGNS